MTMLAGDFEHSGRFLEVEIVTRAPAVRVWEAWTDPARLVEWLPDRVVGAMQPGETVQWHFDRPKSEMTFRVGVMVPMTRLVLESAGAVPSKLEVSIGAAHDGTRIQLIHSGFSDDHASDDDFHAIASGWRLALAVLRYYVEFHFGQPRKTFAVVRQARYALGRLSYLYRNPAGLSEWLTDGGSLGTPGGRVHLALRSGETLRGDMLADTGVDIAMAWDEIQGVLELRALPIPNAPALRSLCLIGWGWGLSSERALQIERDLNVAIDQLERSLETSESGQGTLAPQSR